MGESKSKGSKREIAREFKGQKDREVEGERGSRRERWRGRQVEGERCR